MVESFRDCFGEQYVSSNVHGFLHICEDVVNYPNQDRSTFTAFEFEDTLQSLKKLIRSPKGPLQQVERRVTEMGGSILVNKKQHKPVMESFGKCRKDSFVVLNSDRVGVVQSIRKDDVEVKLFLRVSEVFTVPISSFRVGCYRTSELATNVVILSKNDVVSKGVGIEISEGVFVVSKLLRYC